MSWRRALYSVLLYIVSPLVPLYLLWRARRQPEYARGLGERFAWRYGCSKRSTATRRVWLHAVSLGETRAAKPLIDALFACDEVVHVILTHTTPTGRAAGRALFAPYLNSGRMTQVYVPYDLPDVVARFLWRFAPTDCWLMETEIWPNMIAACVKRGISVSLLNGRLSDKTLQKTLKNGFFAKLFKQAYGQLSNVCAQSVADGERYEQLGVSRARLTLTGNLKFDMSTPHEQVAAGLRWRASRSNDRRIVLLASTREGEERLWLDALHSKAFDGVFDDVQWWLVPRHPQRFSEVENLLRESGFAHEALVRKTTLDSLAQTQRSESLNQARVLLGDTMGEMFAYYAAADVVLMGGAWQPLGGQNFLEPLSIGKPTIIGPHTYNFVQAAQDAVAASALIQVADIFDALHEVQRLLAQDDERERYGANAQAFVGQHQGAVARTLNRVLCGPNAR
jgi:3-deoxy-D-manno-octulosonic-acid transferase